MSESSGKQFHTEAEIQELNETLVSDMQKLRLTKSDEWTFEDDMHGTAAVTEMEASGGQTMQVVTAAGVYPSTIIHQYSIAGEIGKTLSGETREELVSGLPDDFPTDAKETPEEAAGLVALTQMDKREQEELNYRVEDVVKGDRVLENPESYHGVTYQANLSGELFPCEPSHNIHKTQAVVRAIQSAANDMINFIRYSFSEVVEKDAEDITSDELMF